MKNRTNMTRRTWVTLSCGLLAGSIGAQVLFNGDSAQAVQADADTALKIGTYNPQAAFEQYPAREELMQTIEQAQQEMQAAQQQGDQQAVMQLQQRLEQAQQQTIEAFYTDVEQAMPEIAAEQDVKVIALEVVYTADDVQAQDVTEQIVASFDE